MNYSTKYPKVKRAVFPVAGFGTRFLPVTKSQPKEMLPIVDKPVIHYLVEEAVASGIEEIILITGRGKRAIEDYFDQSFELEYNLVQKEKMDLLTEVLEIPKLAKFIYVRQPVPRGDGHAILQAYSILKDEPFAVMFGDDLVNNEVPALKQLLNVYEQTGSSVIGLTEVLDKDLGKYGVVGVKTNKSEWIEIGDFVEKPKTVEEAPSNLGVIGKYIVTPRVLERLREFAADPSHDGEIRLADGFRKTLDEGGLLCGKKIEGQRYDAGSKLGYMMANVDFALNHPEIGEAFAEFLKGKVS